MPRFACLVLLLSFVAGAASADGMTMDHSADSTAGNAPSTAAFEAANATMHEAMAIDFTGEPDVDFVRGMIGHHKGAIEMAKAELQYGTDPEIRALAEGIIAAQTAEIAKMETWMAQQGH